MNFKNCALAQAGSACLNSAQRYVLVLVPALPELTLLIVLEAALWML